MNLCGKLTNKPQLFLASEVINKYLLYVRDESEVGIVESFEHYWVSPLVRVASERGPPEGLLYQFPVWLVATLLGRPHHGAQLGEPAHQPIQSREESRNKVLL